MKFLRLLWTKKHVLLIFALLGFALGYFLTEGILNKDNIYYSLNYNASSEFDSKQLEGINYYEATLNSISEYNDKVASGLIEGKRISVASIDYNELIKSKAVKVLEIDGIVTLKVKAKFFPTILKSSSTGEPNFGYLRFVNYYRLLLKSDYSMTNIVFNEYSDGNLYQISGELNSWSGGVLGLVVGLGCAIVLYFVLFLLNKTYEDNFIADNLLIYRSPFHIGYWKKAFCEYKSIKNLAIIAMLFAMMLVCKAIRFPSGFGDLGIAPTFVFFALIGLLYGPVIGLGIGMVSDVLGFFLFPTSGVFNFGYTLSAMLTGFAYGIAFYRTKVTFSKCFFVRIFVNFFINVFLGSIWWAIIYKFNFEQFRVYLTLISLPKNLIYLVPQSIVLFIAFKAFSRVLKASDLLDPLICDNITLY